MKINLGCGKNYIPGFVHVDLDEHPHIDHRSNVKDLSFFENNSAELIYSSHTLEYFDRKEVVDVLSEWYRVLKPEGVLRIAVPDFEAIVKVYKKYNDLDHQGILGPLYGFWPYKSTCDKIDTFYHKTTYDFNSLKKLLFTSGFSDVKRYAWENTIHKDYDDFSQAYIPHMAKENGILISLNVEAVK
ncbi:MAG: methyltransferase domain-containing protein [Candidatus Marinimicrobia bacterium]|jgi:predicted SAM-dependent methyltransferase|nr:methyltransferase domain-containing protein [Candidatus Neomarinimicrobiota bacterium]